MEIGTKIEKLINEQKIALARREIVSDYTFDDLTVIGNDDDFTLQYNSKGIVTIYYRNSQYNTK